MVRRRGSDLRARRRAVDATEAATCLQMLAVLLQAGAQPVEAWHHLASTGEQRAEAIAERLRAEDGVVEALEAEGGAWRDVAAAWEIATTVGAPLADVLRSVAETLRDAAAGADDVRIALAEPAGTARLLLWMPVAGLFLGLVLGFDTIGAVTRNPVGAACLGLGLGLVLAARAWTRRLLARAAPPPGTPGLQAELVAVALSGGASVERARRLVRETSVETVDDERVPVVLELSRSAGVPAVELLRAAAAHERHAARVRGRMRAARLSTRLLLPLGVCTLPAFLLLGVAPLLLSVLGSTPLPT